jgi:phage terminase large subunit-like protein
MKSEGPLSENRFARCAALSSLVRMLPLASTMTVLRAMRRPYLWGNRVLREQQSELARFTRFCETHLRLEDGRPLIVEDFQKQMLRDYFAGTTETVILVPKKNSKSTSAAAVALFHLVTTPDAECVVVAASREQAGILFTRPEGSCAARSG